MSETRFWCSFIQPTDDHRPLTYPPNEAILGWWCSGYNSEDHAILCALVKAETEGHVWNAIITDWPEAITMRFCDQVDKGWRPNDRFVITDWQRERIGIEVQS